MAISNPFTWMDSKSLVTNLIVTTLTVVISVSTLVYTTQLTGPLPISVTQTSTEKTSSFDVTGESEIVTIPDQAVVSVGFTITGSSVARVQDQANQTLNAITNALTDLGIKKDDIQTQNYSINPTYDFQGETQRITGYNVYSTLQITIKDLEQTNSVIDTATANGANQVGGVQFTLSEEKENQLRQEARKEAIKDAKDSASELADLAGMRLGKIVNVIENRSGGVQPPIAYARSMDAMALGGEAVAPTQVEPGSTTYHYIVTLSYETL